MIIKSKLDIEFKVSEYKAIWGKLPVIEPITLLFIANLIIIISMLMLRL